MEQEPETDHFGEDPPDAANFLQRYREARAASAPNSPAQKAPSSPQPSPKRTPSGGARRGVWGVVFHPLGKSPTSADRYDLSPGQRSAPGMSASEVHAKGTGISLDAKTDE